MPGGKFLVAILVYLTVAGVTVLGQSLVDTVDLKVCTTDHCSSNNKISQLQDYATELTKNQTSQYQPINYNTNFDFTKGAVEATTMDDCDGQGTQYLADVVSSLNNDLATASSYIGKLYTSCSEIYDKETNPEDGYYKIKKADGTLATVYCLMSSDKCSGGGGWMRVGYFDTTSTDEASRQCPSPLVETAYTELTQKLCQRESDQTGCDSFYYDSNGLSYSKVCGRAIGYQYGSPDSFTSTNVDDNYLDGLSLTYGSGPRTHIWSFVAGVNTDGLNHWDCPCNSFNNDNPPAFVGDDYYCESGQDEGDDWNPVRLQSLDPLWDGVLCRSLEGGCCKSNTLPWFTKDLGKSITDDIEIRLCDDETIENERVPIELLELYVQ